LYDVVLAEVSLSDELAIHGKLDSLKPVEGVNKLGPFPKTTFVFRYNLF